ncbi:MAG TPA: tripartite tricarboxylate transporter substrate binding protein [Ramlibacter sp.]|nr:tripartite tricarboxylate transporter substrate binding protein [Ramlibacter sp.]
MNHSRAVLLALAAFCLPAAVSAQQQFPSHPVKIVVPFGAGTGLDVMARGYAERLTEQLKVPVLVENRDGAGGSVGAVAVARAKPDGYTIVFTANAPFSVAPFIQAKTYDPLTDFAPISKVAVIPMVLITGAKSQFKTLGDMVTYAKGNPGKLDYASSGVGTASHLAVELIKARGGVDITAVPYKSTAQAMSDIIGGQLPLYMPSFPAALGQLKSGQVRALAIGGLKRSSVMPDIPTLAEVLKQPDAEASVWYGFLAPKGTPQGLVDRLNEEIAKATGTPQIAALIEKIGGEVALGGPRDLQAQIQRDVDESGKLLRALGIKPAQ